MLVLLLFIAAVMLIYIELFLPGGVFGILGAIALISSMALAIYKYEALGFMVVVAEIVAALILILIGLKRFPRSYAGRLLILGRNLDKKSGYSGTESFERFEGQEGISLTRLRPAGIAKIGSERLDVVTEGAFIDKGKTVRVVEVEGNRVVVREVEPTTSETGG